MKVLITNDDGFFAQGLKALSQRIGRNHDIFIVAPQTEQSGISQAITFLRPLHCKPILDKQQQLTGYSVNGTPADCVKLGIHELAPWKPDLIVSGINFGNKFPQIPIPRRYEWIGTCTSWLGSRSNTAIVIKAFVNFTISRNIKRSWVCKTFDSWVEF